MNKEDFLASHFQKIKNQMDDLEETNKQYFNLYKKIDEITEKKVQKDISDFPLYKRIQDVFSYNDFFLYLKKTGSENDLIAYPEYIKNYWMTVMPQLSKIPVSNKEANELLKFIGMFLTFITHQNGLIANLKEAYRIAKKN